MPLGGIATYYRLLCVKKLGYTRYTRYKYFTKHGKKLKQIQKTNNRFFTSGGFTHTSAA
jgi:hypothetical protein